jgi:putative ABC transport system permease protein
MTYVDPIQIARASVSSLRSYFLRSLLATIGIVIAVASVIAVVSMIQGFSKSITDSFSGLGADTITVNSYTPIRDQVAGRLNKIRMHDYRKLERQIASKSVLSPSFGPFGQFGTTVSYSRQSAYVRVLGVTDTFQDVNRSYPASGRFLTRSDSTSRRRVAVLGADMPEQLGLERNAIGEFVSIGGEWFKIIGIMEAKGSIFGLSQDEYVLIPFEVGEALSDVAGEQDITITLRPQPGTSTDELRSEIAASLSRILPPQADGQRSFQVQTAEQQLQSLDSITAGATFILGGMVGISLLVGGIGIMNIMLVAVKERTKEIGICKALGANRAHILLQFLIEATILTTAGGIIGVVLGWILGAVAAYFIPNLPGAIVPGWAACLAVGFSAVTGIVFGVIPAAQAANLNPIDALRYE